MVLLVDKNINQSLLLYYILSSGNIKNCLNIAIPIIIVFLISMLFIFDWFLFTDSYIFSNGGSLPGSPSPSPGPSGDPGGGPSGDPGPGPGNDGSGAVSNHDNDNNLDRRRRLKLADYLEGRYNSEINSRKLDAPNQDISYVNHKISLGQLGIKLNKSNPYLSNTSDFDGYLIELKIKYPHMFSKSPGKTLVTDFIRKLRSF